MHECTVHERINLDDMLEATRPREAPQSGHTSPPNLIYSTWRNQSRGEPGHQSSQHLAAASGQTVPVASYARARTFSPAWLHRPFGVSFRACWKSLYSCNRRPVSAAAPSLHRLCAGKESAQVHRAIHAGRFYTPQWSLLSLPRACPSGLRTAWWAEDLVKTEESLAGSPVRARIIFFPQADLGCPKLIGIGRLGSAVSCKGH